MNDGDVIEELRMRGLGIIYSPEIEAKGRHYAYDECEGRNGIMRSHVI